MFRSRPGTCTSNICDGEKPSLLFHSSGAIALPCLLLGIESICRLTLMPVLESLFVCVSALLGQGSRQLSSSRISQRCALWVVMEIGGSDLELEQEVSSAKTMRSSGLVNIASILRIDS